MEKKELLKHSNSKVHVQHAVLEKQIMADMRHRNVVQVRLHSVVFPVACPATCLR